MEKLITLDEMAKMIRNGQQTLKDHIGNHRPVVMLHVPELGFVWLLSELYPNDPDIAFGLCDLAMGFPELGSVSLSEICKAAEFYGFSVQRLNMFKATKTLLEYSEMAHEARKIVL